MLTQADFENKALQIADDIFPFDEPPSHGNITALAAQLYQILAAHNAGAQEPAAYMWRDGGAWELTFDVPPPTATKSVPLYAHPQPIPETAAARDALAKAVARYDELTGSIQGCTDGGCLIRKPEGMHTNGGCRCARDHVKMQRAMYAAGKLRKALAEIERLDRAKGE